MRTGRLSASLAIDLAAEAFSTIRANPLRAGLAALAIAAAVATMSVIVTGLQAVERSAMETAARSFGSDTFVIARVVPSQIGRRELQEKLRRNAEVTRADARFLERYAGGEVLYTAVVQRPGDVIAGSRRFENATIGGTGSALAALRDLGIAEGRFFTAQEEQEAALVAVIGADVAAALFPGTGPLGHRVRIAGRAFIVIGVQARQGTGGGASLDRNVWMPLRAWERAFGAPGSLQVFARKTERATHASAEDRARVTMRARRALAPGAEDTFDLLVPEAARSFVLSISQRISVAGIPISVMALLAAVAVVTNTILVSVTQRTREIGVRRAIGGTRLHITIEVVAEAAIVALAGGLTGILTAGLVLALAGDALAFEMPLTGRTVAWSLTAAVGSGILAAWYPARRATRLDVVSALRQE